MNRLRHRFLQLAVLLPGLLSFAPAQPALTVPPAVAATNSPAVAVKSPVELFRELLAQNEPGREAYLATRAPATRERIRAKLVEYESLSPDERKLRLRVTELQWYLMPLLSLPRDQQKARLEQIPSDLRPLVEARLDQWSLLPPEYQQELLDNEKKVQLFMQLAASSAAQQRTIINTLPPNKRNQVEQDFNQWIITPPGAPQKLTSHLDDFLHLTDAEKSEVLKTLNEPEREQIKETLLAFAHLPEAQRDQCVQSFAKFAAMSPAERQQFLQKAERWAAMSPAERQAWRDLVAHVPDSPPLPLGYTPPSPTASGPALVTNKN